MTRVGNVSNDEEVFSLLSPQQKICWDGYSNPKSKTFGNATQSALAAGYAMNTARIITRYDWFKHRLIRLNLLGKAEKVLDKTLSMETQDSKGREQADLLRIQNDSAKFIAKTLGKDEGYSERNEVTGANGNPIVFLPVELMEKYGIDADKKEAANLLDN